MTKGSDRGQQSKEEGERERVQERERKQTLDVELAVDEVDRVQHFQISVCSRGFGAHHQIVEHVNDLFLEDSFRVSDHRMAL